MKRFVFNGLSVLSICVITAIIFNACAPSAPEPLPLIRIGYSPHDHHAPLYIAAMNPDYFNEHGGVYLKERFPKREYELFINGKAKARVTIESSIGGKVVVRKLAEDQLDAVFGGIPAMISFIDSGSRFKIVAPVMTEGAGLIVSPGMPVSSWDEFIAFIAESETPVRIGYKTDLSVQNLIFEYALRESGIPYSYELTNKKARVLLLNMYGPKNLIPALKNEILDAFVVNQPLPAKAEYENAGKFISSLSDLPPEGKWQGNPCCALAFCDKFLKEQPEIVESFITLMLRANLFIQQNQKMAAEQVASWLDQPVEVEEKSLPTINYTVDFDEPWDRGVNFWVEAMMSQGQLDDRVKKAYRSGNVNELLYNRPLYDRARKNL
ncbi:ABC transporter substrate-binding protein [Thermodesulfobacteriota bacterium]